MLKKSIILSSLLLSVGFAAETSLEGSHSIISKHSGNCLDLESSKSNAKVVQTVCDNKEFQKFDLVNVSGNIYTISGLKVAENSNSNGANIFNGDSAQEFELEPHDGYYKIKSVNSGKYITAKPYTSEVIQYFGHNSDDQLWQIGTTGGETNAMYSSCKEILDAGASNGDGTYLIDVDKEGEIEPFNVYCDMTNNDGGWTLFANHKDGLTGVKSEEVTKDNFAVLNDAKWNALKSNMSVGMMFIDEHSKISFINESKLRMENICQNIPNSTTLERATESWIWHQENSGCSGTGVDYSIVSLDNQSIAGASVYNAGSVKFDQWPYAGKWSHPEQNELLYFIK